MRSDTSRRAIADVRVARFRPDGHSTELPDRLVVEEPLEIRVGGPGQEPIALTVTMRTPGADFELAAGLLIAEGIVGPDAISQVKYCELPAGEEQLYNVVTVRTTRRVDVEARARLLTTSSSCGICGTRSLEDIAVRSGELSPGPSVPWSVLAALPDRMRDAQRVFDVTGALHAAASFTPDGTLEELREDVGRHNAVDKIVGHAALYGALPLSGRILCVSGRLGFEIVQKAAVAGFPIVCAVSAPSSLAVDAARQVGMTLVGFVRGGSGNVYAGPERIAAGA